jgi:hypothetical protein
MSGPSNPNSSSRRALWLAALCGLAFALSCAYVRVYLRGGPRIIDATSYFLEARSLAAGGFSFHVPDPTAAFRGRFLLSSSDGHALGVIFPPGYPLLLALGMRLGAPLLLGPALAALLVAATYGLARALGEATRVAWVAAALSALCAALRYHTADTMSHGLAALLGCAALALALRREQRGAALLSGLCLGLLLATRPVTGCVSCLLVGFTLRGRTRAWPALLAGMLPGVALLLAQQRALTGAWLGSTQLAYYAVADAPPGCFRYGFGAGIGCRFEHGQYVARFLPHGLGLGHALRNLVVHLVAFATDATNAAPLSLLGGYALGRHLRSPLGLLGAGILLQALAYMPFYFDGNYPGGGARFLCEAIPFCQILVARAACDLRIGWLAPLAALAGFGLYARHGHEQLRDREGGRPMFEPDVVARAGVERGLLFVDTDHGFNLGYRPQHEDPKTSLVVARARGDAHDRELYERLGRPAAFRYVFDFKGLAPPRLLPFTPPPSARLEAEAEWPALLERGSAYPIHYPCASAAKALRLYPGTTAGFWVPELVEHVTIGWINTGGRGASLRVAWTGSKPELVSADSPGCSTLRLTIARPEPHATLLVGLVSGEGALDFIQTGSPAPG